MSGRGEARLPAVVPCPVCGQDKWRYLGGDLDHEPPCFNCCNTGHAPVSGHVEAE